MVSNQDDRVLKFDIMETMKKFKGKIKLGLDSKSKKTTGSIYFDYLINGGFEEDTISLYYGPSASGKTTMALRNIAAAQRRGETCAWVRVEKGANEEFMRKIGVDVDKLIVVEKMESGEDYLDAVVHLVEQGIDMLVVDSISSLVTKSVMENGFDKKTMGAQAALLSTFFAKVNAINHKSIIILISQVREEFNSMGYTKYKFAGGKSAQHTCNYIIEFKLKDRLDDDQKEIGSSELKSEIKREVSGAMMHVFVAKCQRGMPFKAGEMYLSFKTGKIDEEGELITVAVRLGFIGESAGWIKPDPEFIKQFGNDKVKESCRAKDLRTLLREDKKAYQFFVDKINQVIEDEA